MPFLMIKYCTNRTGTHTNTVSVNLDNVYSITKDDNNDIVFLCQGETVKLVNFRAPKKIISKEKDTYIEYVIFRITRWANLTDTEKSSYYMDLTVVKKLDYLYFKNNQEEIKSSVYNL